MKTIMLASAIALGISTGAAFAATLPSGDVSTHTKPTSGVQITQGLNSIGTAPAARRAYVDSVRPSWSNPTGQVEYGPNGTISLYAPTSNGNG